MKSMRSRSDQSIRGAEKDNLEEFCAPGTTYFDRMIQVTNGVSLRLVSFFPRSKSQRLPVVLVPGLVSVMLTFKNILIELTKNFTVHYVETREKSSSIVTNNTEYDVSSIGMDINAMVSYLNLKKQEYVLCGASLSASAIIDRYSKLKIDPFCMVLLEPNAVFDYPKWSLFFIRYSAPLYRFLRPVVKWYLKHFRVNTKEDYEMYEINCRALNAADPYKLRDAVLAISTYQIWDRLDSVNSPTLIICASKDTFHRHDDISKMNKKIVNSVRCDLETHKRIHSREFVDQLQNFMGTVGHEN